MRASVLYTNKYITDIFVPNPLLQVILPLIGVGFCIILTLFTGTLKNRRLLRIATEVKTGAILATLIPVTVSCVACLFNVVYLGFWTEFSITSCAFSIIILFYYTLELNTIFYPAKDGYVS